MNKIPLLLLLLFPLAVASQPWSAQAGACRSAVLGSNSFLDYDAYSDDSDVATVTYASPSLTVCGVRPGPTAMTVEACVPNRPSLCYARRYNVRVVDTRAPEAPTGLTASLEAQTSFRLSWTAGADGGDPCPSSVVFLDGDEVAALACGATSFDFSGLEPATSYTAGVRMEDWAENRSALVTEGATTLSGDDETPPGVPTSLTATGGTGSVFLSWANPGDPDLAGIRVYRGTTSGALSLYQSLGVVTSYTDVGVTNGVTYYYALTAVDGVPNESDPTAERSATPSAPAPGETFAETLNPTGDPIGGGPGYTGAWRTAEGFSGQAIYSEADCTSLGADCHLVTTEADLRAAALTYYDRTLGTGGHAGASPATSGQLVYLKGVGGVLEVNDTVALHFNDGVTVASDLGRDLGDGAYSWGTTVTVNAPLFTQYALRGLFDLDSDWRLTGVILEGPSVWANSANIQDQQLWRGAMLGLRADNRSYSKLPEVDNVWLFGFDYMGINAYQGPISIHHVRVNHSQRQGYGYGLYMGRDAVQSDGITTTQRSVGVRLHNMRHFTDGSGLGFGPGPGYVPTHQTIHDHQSLLITGNARSRILNVHAGTNANGTTGASYGIWQTKYSRVAEISDYGIGLGVLAAWPQPSGGLLSAEYLWVTDNILSTDVTDNSYWIQREGTYAHSWYQWQTSPNPPAIVGTVDLDYSTFYSFREGVVSPTITGVLSDSTITAGDTVVLPLEATDPDGHAIRYYEVIWGDGPDRGTVSRGFPGDTLSHVYASGGVFRPFVTAINEHGVPGYRTYTVYVAPADLGMGRRWTVMMAPDLPPVIHADYNDFSGAYECQLLVNGVEVASFDWGAPANRGWRSYTASADSTEASLAGATTVTFTIRVEALDPTSAHASLTSGRCLWDNFWLFGDEGLEADGAAWDRMDPMLDTPRNSLDINTDDQIAYDWSFAGRVNSFDTANDAGYQVGQSLSSTTPGAASEKASRTRPYLHAPPGADASEGGGNTTITWTTQGLATAVQIEYGATAAYGSTVTTDDDGSHVLTGTGLYWRIRAAAPHWDGSGTVYSAWHEHTPGGGP